MAIERKEEKKLLSNFSKAGFKVIRENEDSEESFVEFRGYWDLEEYKRGLEVLRSSFYMELESNCISMESPNYIGIYLLGVMDRIKAVKSLFYVSGKSVRHNEEKCINSDFIADGRGFDELDLEKVSEFLKYDIDFIDSLINYISDILNKRTLKSLEWNGNSNDFVKVFGDLIMDRKIGIGGVTDVVPIAEFLAEIFVVPKAKGKGNLDGDSLVTYFKKYAAQYYSNKGKKMP